MTAAQTKSQNAADALLAVGKTIKNRQHAWIVLRDAGLTGSQQVVNAAIAEYEKHFDVVLGDSRAVQQRNTNLAAQAHQMSADEVLAYLDKIDAATPLFWVLWRLYKDSGKWKNQLKQQDFARHFAKRGGGNAKS